MFQSTPSRGGRQLSAGLHGQVFQFQSTPSRGGRRNQKPLSVGCFVSIHALTRRATQSIPLYQQRNQRFNPRPHAEGDNEKQCDNFKPKCFNPRPHAEGDKRQNRSESGFAVFQSTPSRGGRPGASIIFCTSRLFQSTPSRGGRPEGDGYEKPCVLVSIHALTRRATAFEIAQGITAEVSIHALTRRATLCKAIEISNSSFNPRPHAEGDD